MLFKYIMTKTVWVVKVLAAQMPAQGSPLVNFFGNGISSLHTTSTVTCLIISPLFPLPSPKSVCFIQVTDMPLKNYMHNEFSLWTRETFTDHGYQQLMS